MRFGIRRHPHVRAPMYAALLALCSQDFWSDRFFRVDYLVACPQREKPALDYHARRKSYHDCVWHASQHAHKPAMLRQHPDYSGFRTVWSVDTSHGMTCLINGFSIVIPHDDCRDAVAALNPFVREQRRTRSESPYARKDFAMMTISFFRSVRHTRISFQKGHDASLCQRGNRSNLLANIQPDY